MAEITYAAQVADDLTYDEAHVRAHKILEGGPPYFTGTRPVCMLSWSFEDVSLWRGLSDKNRSAGSQHGHHWLLPRRAKQFRHI